MPGGTYELLANLYTDIDEGGGEHVDYCDRALLAADDAMAKALMKTNAKGTLTLRPSPKLHTRLKNSRAYNRHSEPVECTVKQQSALLKIARAGNQCYVLKQMLHF
jgi:hypothetical protein